MPRYESIRPYRSARHRWFAAALPWLFVIAVVAVTMLPVRDWVRRMWPHPADTQAARDAETVWRNAGDPGMRHPVDVIRTIDGDTFLARVHLRSGLDPVTRVRLRGIDAPELKAVRRGIADGPGCDHSLACAARRRRGYDLEYRSG